jgi:hypothetical protein
MKSYKVAILWRGDRASRSAATPQNNRYHRVFEELEAHGIRAEPAVFDEDMVDEVEDQLMGVDGVLVWVNPIEDGRTRDRLEPMLRELASKRPWVNAHPDVILKMGVKEVLHRTKHVGWGTDTHLYRTAAEFRDGFPAQLASGGARVLKQNRGNGGQGIWKVELRGPSRRGTVSVLEARRGSVPEDDEAIVPNFSSSKHPGEGGDVVDNRYSWSFFRLLTKTVGIGVDSGSRHFPRLGECVTHTSI